MLYNINGKSVNIIVKDEQVKLEESLERNVLENFEKMKESGANIWNGDLLCVSDINVGNTTVELICKKSNYAHYLYGERVGCPPGYECRNLSAGCMLETEDGYYVIGELDDTTSYPGMLQTTGGGIDKKDISDGKISVMQTIAREAKEELNIDLMNEDIIEENRLSYLFVSGENEQPGVQIFSKAIIKMTSQKLENYFQEYYNYLREEGLEREFKKLHFLKREKAILELEELQKKFRAYMKPLLLADSKEKDRGTKMSR